MLRTHHKLLRALLFLLFTILILIKIALFQKFCIGFVLLDPRNCGWITYFGFWLPKIAVSLLVATPLLFIRNPWYSIVWMLIIDFWIVANLIYFRANSLLLTLDAILMSGNLKGFTSSILLYLDWRVWIYFLLTFIYCIVCFFCRQRVLLWKSGIVVIILAIASSLAGGTCRYQSFTESEQRSFRFSPWLNPFVTPPEIKAEDWLTERDQMNYVMSHSIVAYSVNMTVEGIRLYGQRKSPKPQCEQQQLFLDSLPDLDSSTLPTPKKNLIILFVESMESWVFDATDSDGAPVTPKINKFLDDHPHLYVPRITSQVKQGMSGDGQMTLNTGLLPISSGAACLLYPHNTYHNFAHLFQNSAIVNPVRKTWNQTDATHNYGYLQLIEPEDELEEFNQLTHRHFWIDNTIFSVSKDMSEQMRTDFPFCQFIITISTHSPFNLYESSYAMHFKYDTPQKVREYLNCMHYADHHAGDYLQWLSDEGFLENTVVVITGDHTVFRNIDFKELQTWAQDKPLSIASEPNYCPLVMFSPDITEDVTVNDICFQMDIYPSILSAVGIEDYPWHGFGTDLIKKAGVLSDETDIQIDSIRPFTVEEAYTLSDLIIRNNAFNK